MLVLKMFPMLFFISARLIHAFGHSNDIIITISAENANESHNHSFMTLP